MTVTPFVNNYNDIYSSPFYDYADDIVYVGDDAGNLEKFTPVFYGPAASPTEANSAAGE